MDTLTDQNGLRELFEQITCYHGNKSLLLTDTKVKDQHVIYSYKICTTC
ncbi:MAG: hypothetical protein K0R59_2880 [Sphingobacterium sp.]|jgi:hypothetical protein|nr:hypothetical protein [Sphingobacterium sp.]